MSVATVATVEVVPPEEAVLEVGIMLLNALDALDLT